MVLHQPSNSRSNYNYNANIYKNAAWTTHFHANYELIYVFEGSAEVSLNGATDTLEKGEMMLVPPYTVHSLFVTEGKTWVGVFSEDFITSFAKQYKYVRFSKFTCSSEMEALLQKHLFFEGRPDHFLHISCLYIVCNECIKNARPLATEQNYKFIYEVITFINEQIHHDIALKSIAEQMNYEYHYFSSLFHQSFGMNFKSFVNLLRFEKACELLGEDISVTDVSEKCGFGSIRNFNRVFKNLSGLTPQEYKKKRVRIQENPIQIGFSLQKDYGCPMPQVISLLREAGFSAVSPVWSEQLDLKELSKAVSEHGMTIQSIHAAHQGSTLLWQPKNPDSLPVVNRILQSIDDCASYGVPILVMHGWHGFYYDFNAESLDFSHFDNIVQHAEKKGVCIAFENLEGEEFLHALLSRYQQKHIGYCWDTGHEHCYPHRLDFVKEFGDRLMMTHINDNLGLRGSEPTGVDDLHFLPFDGTIDWKENIARLQRCPHQPILNFELKIVSQSSAPEDLIYSDLSLKEYLTRAAERARRIAKMYPGEKR